MTTPSISDLSALREVAEKATPGPWDVWREPCADKYEAANELSEQAHLTDGFSGAVFLLNANGKCQASTGCGPTSEANAAFIAAFNPQTVLALLDHLASEKAWADEAEAERNTFKAKDASKSKLLERFRDLLMNMCDHFEDEGDRVYFGSTNDPDELRDIAQQMDDWKWDAVMGQTTSDPYADLREQRARADKAENEAKFAYAANANHEATIASLTEQLAEAREGWNPIVTCPIREPVDLWCVYGGEEFAQYEGGAPIGRLVPNRTKTKEYGFFGNQSDNGVPQRDAPDLVPVAWRKAVPSCPAALIAEALGIPVTLEDARATLSRLEKQEGEA